jgi:hypothetical protein
VGVSYPTIKKWNKRYGFPVIRTLGSRVMSSPSAIDEWIRRVSDEERRILRMGPEPRHSVGVKALVRKVRDEGGSDEAGS